jgi:hypothetical protein
LKEDVADEIERELFLKLCEWDFERSLGKCPMYRQRGYFVSGPIGESDFPTAV